LKIKESVMGNRKKRQRRQEALRARHNASRKQQGSFIANEVNHLVGADQESVKSLARWGVKANFWASAIGFPIIILAFIHATYRFHGNPGAGQFFLFFWIAVAFISFFFVKSMLKYKKLIE
jgi:hypothetical protein|tara:strand:- start:200 stop:562 length:363 start_codon:yes stop_codon:yes gene_type:complete